MASPLSLSRAQVLGFRRRAGGLLERLPYRPESLRIAAWAGLQDSMPRAALLALHARVESLGPDAWEDPALAQVWGPRYTAYVVPARDAAVFTLGRLPDGAAARKRARDAADRLDEQLAGARRPHEEIGVALGIHPNQLRYATTTGTVRIRWDGARGAVVWTVDPPEMDPAEARLELARRHLCVYGPSTPEAFAGWAGLPAEAGRAAFRALVPGLLAVTTPAGSGWILALDEASFRHCDGESGPAVRLLPSGDPYFLHQGAARELLLANPSERAELWPSRVWPGAVLLDGEIRGTWRRAGTVVVVHLWGRPPAAQRQAIETEAAALPLPGLAGRLQVRWS